MLFSDQIFEAIITGIDHKNGVCTISPIDVNTNATITDVPIPHFAGNGNAGIFYGLTTGSRVVAMFTSGRSREVTVITGIIPKPGLYRPTFNLGKPDDIPSGTIPYPEVKAGEVILRGDKGSQLRLDNSGNVSATTVNGGGINIKRNQARSAYTLASEDKVEYTNASKEVSGPVRRMSGANRNLFPRPDLSQTPLFADTEYATRTVPYGFFVGDRPLRRSYKKRKRNPEISEYRMVINEFSTDYMFTGFDDEVARATNSVGMYDNMETFKRNREQGNTLHMAEHELIEVIGGNLVDINGNILDLNYNPLSYGDNNSVPTSQLAINYDRARRISRRGIGYHFQLSTNTRSTDVSESSSNFIFDIDKEGLLKVNIPASTDTGNIPFSSNANYIAEGDSVEVSFSNPSVVEPVPVTLRDENGEIVFPSKGNQGITHRKTGIRYSVGEESPYFPPEGDGITRETRVNPTKHHNMYAAAEMLIANTVRIVNIPTRFADKDGLPEGISASKPFEVAIPDSLNHVEGSIHIQAGKSDFPTYMSVVAVEPGPPAIYHGGGYHGGGEGGKQIGTLIAGKLYTDEEDFPPYSNAFNSSVVGDEVSADITDGGDKARPVGGKSANLNFEGSIEASVGKDNYDQKSMILDTAGSIIAWLGKDSNGRSMVMQTDGDFLLNVGGSYEGGNSEDKVMSKGRFDLRVNVTDKKFVSTKFSESSSDEDVKNPHAESDYIISISENGIVIAGMKKAAPMVFRNDGPVLIESTSSDVTIKGIQVKTVGPKGSIKVDKPPARN